LSESIFSGEAAAEVIVDPPGGHPPERVDDDPGVGGAGRAVGGGLPRGGAEEQAKSDRVGELRCAAEATVDGVVAGAEGGGRRVEPGHARIAWSVARRGGRLADRPGDLGGLSQRLAPAVVPGVDDRAEHLTETRHAAMRIGRPVGAGEERLERGGEEHAHRPPRPAGEELHRLHVDRVDVGAFLAVDLDRDEMGVEEGGDACVLEALVGHHMAPVAGRIPDRQEDRLVLADGAGERLRAPRLPGDGLLDMLEEIRARRTGEAVGHGGDQPRVSPAPGKPRDSTSCFQRPSASAIVDFVSA
jgi:hypothetical protein